MNWMDNPYRHTATEVEDLSYPPSGGRTKLIRPGILGGIACGAYILFI